LLSQRWESGEGDEQKPSGRQLPLGHSSFLSQRWDPVRKEQKPSTQKPLSHSSLLSQACPNPGENREQKPSGRQLPLEHSSFLSQRWPSKENGAQKPSS
jgi:hypothetical protein